MKRLGLIVSIVPVIAKADSLTIEERLEFKQRVTYLILLNRPIRDRDQDNDDDGGDGNYELKTKLH